MSPSHLGYSTSTRESIHPQVFMRSEHPRAMARGRSAGHEGMVGVMVEGWWGWGWKDSGGGGGWWWWWWWRMVWSTPNDLSSRPSRVIHLIASHPPPHRIIIVSSSSSSSSSSIVGTAIQFGVGNPSSVGHVGADLKSSADSVVADLKSSNECPSRAPALLLAQSQQQQARHKVEAKTHPTGCLTIVRAAGATIVAPQVVVVVVRGTEISPDQTLTRRFGTRPESPDLAKLLRIARLSHARLNICESSYDDSQSAEPYSDSRPDS
ncbi:hypothetical protein BDZ89DRAFT_1118660 [Hymenopellis radicata]|nr:hypothetical protein BDZ89DRAFT_1118660 [Hymenopellis radicata]